MGRLVPEKEVHTLIRAYTKTATTARLIVAGPGQDDSEYQDTLNSLAADDPGSSCSDRCTAHRSAGCSNTLPSLFSPAASRSSDSPPEAVSVGAYPVVSDIPPHREVLSASGAADYGHLVPVGDEARLAAAIDSALELARDSGGLSLAFSQRVREHYNWQSATRQTIAVYRAAVQTQEQRCTRRQVHRGRPTP